MAISEDSSNRGNNSAEEWQVITPSNTAELNPRPRGIMVNVAGNLSITDKMGNNVVITVIAGVIHPIRPKLILTTGTTATGITGYY